MAIRRTVFGIIVLVLCLFLALFSYSLYRLHNSINFHVPANKQSPKQYSLLVKNVKFQTSDKFELSAWYIPVENAKGAIILIHGHEKEKGGKATMLRHASYLNKAGYSTLLLDLRSFGESQGNKITLGVSEWKDLEAAFNYLKELPENKNRKIGFFGESMGASISIIASGKIQKGDFVIASSPYANFDNLFKAQIKKENFPIPIFLPLLKLSALFELGFDYQTFQADDFIKNIHTPIFLISSKKDTEVGDDNGLILKRNVKEYWEEETGHNLYTKKPDEFKRRVLNFLDKYIK